jgi:hypothetical protein
MDEFCAGVKILLKRMESHPDEFKDRGKWEIVTRAVFAHKEGNFAEAWTVRSLTHAEIDALHAGCVKIYRLAFDEYVMKEILAEPEETLRYRATERYVQGFTDPRMYQNAIQPGTMISVTAGGSGGGGGGIYQSTTTTQTVTTENQKFGIGWILRKLKTK